MGLARQHRAAPDRGGLAKSPRPRGRSWATPMGAVNWMAFILTLSVAFIGTASKAQEQGPNNNSDYIAAIETCTDLVKRTSLERADGFGERLASAGFAPVDQPDTTLIAKPFLVGPSSFGLSMFETLDRLDHDLSAETILHYKPLVIEDIAALLEPTPIEGGLTSLMDLDLPKPDPIYSTPDGMGYLLVSHSPFFSECMFALPEDAFVMEHFRLGGDTRPDIWAYSKAISQSLFLSNAEIETVWLSPSLTESTGVMSLHVHVKREN